MEFLDHFKIAFKQLNNVSALRLGALNCSLLQSPILGDVLLFVEMNPIMLVVQTIYICVAYFLVSAKLLLLYYFLIQIAQLSGDFLLPAIVYVLVKAK